MITPQHRIKEIETTIRYIMGSRPDEYFHRNGFQKEQVKQLESLLWERKEVLDGLFVETPESKNCYSQIENTVYALKRKMLRRMLTLYRLNILTGNDPDFDHDYELMGRIEIGVYYNPDEPAEENNSVLTMPDEDSYGSDFKYMLPAIREFKCKGASIVDGIALTNIHHTAVPKDHEPTADEILGCHYYELEDNKPWSEKIQELKTRQVYIKSPLEDLSYWPLSTPDILRINNFDIQVELWCQHFSHP